MQLKQAAFLRVMLIYRGSKSQQISEMTRNWKVRFRKYVKHLKTIVSLLFCKVSWAFVIFFLLEIDFQINFALNLESYDWKKRTESLKRVQEISLLFDDVVEGHVNING